MKDFLWILPVGIIIFLTWFWDPENGWKLKKQRKHSMTKDTPWSLDVSLDNGHTWKTVKYGPSCDSCKTFARKWYHKDSYGNINPNVMYRIYALHGEQLYLISFNNQSWRMRWNWANLKSRRYLTEGDALRNTFIYPPKEKCTNEHSDNGGEAL